MPIAPLHLVRIQFDTPTYQEIEKDIKISLEGQVGVIGGTLGLFLGFSILSGVEIIYFIGMFIVEWVKKKIWPSIEPWTTKLRDDIADTSLSVANAVSTVSGINIVTAVNVNDVSKATTAVSANNVVSTLSTISDQYDNDLSLVNV